MSEPAAHRPSRPAWSRLPLLRPLAALTVMVVLVGLGVPGDIPLPEPVAVTCDSVGYAYDAAGRLVGAHFEQRSSKGGASISQVRRREV